MSIEWVEIGDCRLANCDCLEVLPTLEAGSVDAVVTDPPYGMNCNTDWARFSGGHRDSVLKRGMGRTYDALIIGDDKPFDPSPWLTFDRVVMWGANHFAKRLPVGTTLVWIKRLDDAFGSFLSDAEIGWMKGGHGVYCRRDLSNNRKPEQRQHATQKPVGIMEWCLDKVKVKRGETAFDPYLGSGTTAIACIRTGRKFIGCEIDRNYFQIACKRIEDEYKRLALFEHPPARKTQGTFL